MKKKKIKIKYKNIFLMLLVLVFTYLLIFSIYKIILWYKDNKNIDKQVNEINKITKIEEVKDNENTELVNPPDEGDKKILIGTILK